MADELRSTFTLELSSLIAETTCGCQITAVKLQILLFNLPVFVTFFFCYLVGNIDSTLLNFFFDLKGDKKNLKSLWWS